MFRFPPPRRLAVRERPRPAPRRFRAQVDTLEGRQLLTFSIQSVQITPQILWPPNGRYVPVHVSGTAIEFHYNGHDATFNDQPGPKYGEAFVVDEYRQINPVANFDPVHVTGNQFTFSFTVSLQAKRAAEFNRGRRYYVNIGLKDVDGWAGKTYAVWVPKSLPPGYAFATTAAPTSAG